LIGLIYGKSKTIGVYSFAKLQALILAIIGLIVGCVTGIIEAFFYNLFAKWYGGVEINLE
jgi:hypothetical protein